MGRAGWYDVRLGVSETDIISEIAAACRDNLGRPRVSLTAMAWLAQHQRRAQRLVFRRHGRIEYQVGHEAAPVVFTPSAHQLELLEHLYILTAHRGQWCAVELGESGDPRRAEKARLQIMRAVRAVGVVAPALADELDGLTCQEAKPLGGTPLMRIPYRIDSPFISTSSVPGLFPGVERVDGFHAPALLTGEPA